MMSPHSEEYLRGMSEARMAINEERHLENKKRFDAIEEKLDTLVQTVAVAKGGLRTLLALSTLSATLGAFAHTTITWILDHVK